MTAPAAKTVLTDPVQDWIAWYISTAVRHEQGALIGIIQAHKRGRLAGGAEVLHQGIQAFVEKAPALFGAMPSAYLRSYMEMIGCPREETAATESAVRIELINALLRHLTDHAAELPDCTAQLPPAMLLPPS